MAPMRRDTAFGLLVTTECTQAAAIRQIARQLGYSPRSIAAWPREGHLPKHVADAVLATVARKRLSVWVARRLAAGKAVSPMELDAITEPEA